MSDAPLADYLGAARELWLAYDHAGPGGVPQQRVTDLVDRWQNAGPHVTTLSPADRSVCKRLHALLLRAATTPEGLCFVTGEAGLIPRADLKAEVQACLDRLEQIAGRRAGPSSTERADRRSRG